MLFDATTGGRTARVEVRETRGGYRVTVGDVTLDLDVVKTGENDASILVDGVSHDLTVAKTPEGFAVLIRGDRFEVDLKDAVKGAVLGKVAHTGPFKLTAPMPGKIVKMLVDTGDSVHAGQGVLVMEAMKMENELKTTRAGTVREIKVTEGQPVEMGALLLVID